MSKPSRSRRGQAESRSVAAESGSDQCTVSDNVTSFEQILSAPHYERLRARLIRMFAARGCPVPEDLADEAIARVTEKLDAIEATFQGNPMFYFLGVARNVYLERRRDPTWVEFDPERDAHTSSPDDSDQSDAAAQCLDKCLAELDPEDRFLIIEYYRYEKAANIDHRELLSEAFDLGLNALRIRAHRIRTRLGRCLNKCVEERKKE